MSEPQEIERPFFPEIEKLFSEYVEYYGGKIVEKLEENDTSKENADYIFQIPEIVAELKTFEKDVFAEDDDFPRILELFEKWRKNEWLTDVDFMEYSFGRKQLPEKCAKDLSERALKTIERAIHKANKQIQKTKETFKIESANGIVFLINDGNYFFDSQQFIMAICNIIGRKFVESNLDVVIYLTINQATFTEDSNLDHSIWFPIYTKIDKNGETIASDELVNFVNDFGNKFLNDFLTIKTGHEAVGYKEIENGDEALKEFKKHIYIPKKIIYKK